MSALTRERESASPAAAPRPLRAGDHLDQKTFHQRYQAMPPGFRAELTGGIVIVPSPAGTDHGRSHARILAWLSAYWAQTPIVQSFIDTTTVLSPDSEVQPDVSLLLAPESGGQARILPGRIEGPPELVVEIAYSTASYDLGLKKRDYEKAGVREYLVIALLDEEINWFRLVDGQPAPGFIEVAPDADGVYRSAVFPGLWLDSQAFFAPGLATLLAVLQQGITTPEHAAFVARLQGA